MGKLHNSQFVQVNRYWALLKEPPENWVKIKSNINFVLMLSVNGYFVCTIFVTKSAWSGRWTSSPTIRLGFLINLKWITAPAVRSMSFGGRNYDSSRRVRWSEVCSSQVILKWDAALHARALIKMSSNGEHRAIGQRVVLRVCVFIRGIDTHVRKSVRFWARNNFLHAVAGWLPLLRCNWLLYLSTQRPD